MTLPALPRDVGLRSPGAIGRLWRSWRGARRIVRFNWPFYAAGATVAAAAAALAVAEASPGVVRVAAASVAATAAFWCTASIVASWIVYDRSVLMTGEWIPAAVAQPASWVTISAGLDEMTPVLRELFPGSRGCALDIYDPVLMTERSIARARSAVPRADVAHVSHAHLPLADGSIEAALVVLSAHEIRSHAARCVLFRELDRVIAPGGRAVIAEHLRDLPNAVAFGPGVLHFHSRRTWHRCFSAAGWHICREWSVTPFVRVFVLDRRGPDAPACRHPERTPPGHEDRQERNA